MGHGAKRAKRACTQREIDMEVAALTLYEVIQDIRAGRRAAPLDILTAKMVLDGMSTEVFNEILANPRPKMTQEYFAVVMYDMLTVRLESTDPWGDDEVYKAFMDQIDTFVVLRHGRLRGLGRRYVHSWFVPMKQ